MIFASISASPQLVPDEVQDALKLPKTKKRNGGRNRTKQKETNTRK
jgi:hypothetical protein